LHPTPALTATPQETAILVGVQTPDVTQAELEDGLDELAQLADTAGARVAHRVTQSLPRLSSAPPTSGRGRSRSSRGS
jgi:50S ribosomal subunit-associated GTPase HflX